MCGIFGYYNYKIPRKRREILELLFKGLHRLEYRGYDSAGIAIEGSDPGSVATENGNLLALPLCPKSISLPIVIKSQGNISALEGLAYAELQETKVPLDTVFNTHVGICHTRWATHGPPSPINSHPISSDPTHEFMVVHNGIITNYKDLKDFLEKEGEQFITETDTEVIPKLCRYIYQRLTEPLLFSQLVMEVMKKLDGAFALLVTSTYFPGELVACKRGSPLILGVRMAAQGDLSAALYRQGSFNKMLDASGHRGGDTEMECFFASDASAVIEYTKRVIVLENDDLVHVKGGGYGIFNAKAKDVSAAVPRVLQTIDMKIESIMKGGYDHYMQKEIHEQPESVVQTMRGRIRFDVPAGEDRHFYNRVLCGGLRDYVPTIKRCRRIMFVACGTSYHACLAARPIMEEMSDTPVSLELASDLMDRHCPIFRDDACVFVSQSGETADTLVALNYAKERGALCMGITNIVGSAISRATVCGIHLNAGYEIGVASTKAYSSQIVAITMIALLLGQDSISKRARVNQVVDELEQLAGKVKRTLALDQSIKALADTLKTEQSLLFFGRGYNYASALEAALKVKEVAYIHSEGILAGEMKHGPLALVDDQMPSIVFVTRDSNYRKMVSVLQQLRARAARLIVVCNEGDDEVREICGGLCQLIEVPQTVDCLQPIINIIPLQLLSYHLTVLRGFNVDQPRNLAKSVTVTDD